MRALVTGVSGQDGWYLSAELLRRGDAVFGLVPPGDPAAVQPGVTPLPGDMTDAASLRAAVRAARPDAVFNLASVSSVALSWQRPDHVADVNGVGAVRLLAAVHAWAQEAGVPVRVVQAGSAEIFGEAAPPQSERTPLAPTTPYGAAKAFAHHAVQVYRRAGLLAANAVLFNHESPRRPERFVTRKITRSVARIASGESVVLPLGNLAARRDWGFAGDYVRALVLMAEHEEAEDFVIATGVSRSVADFVRAAFAHVGIGDWRRYVVVDEAEQRPGDAAEQRGDASRARAVLNWEPVVGFEDLVGQMVDADLALLARGGGG